MQGSAGSTVRIPITLTLSSGVAVDSVAFGLQIAPNNGAPALSSSLSFVTDAALPAPSQIDTAAGPDLVSVAWLGLTGALTGTVKLGDVLMTVPASATASSTYSATITGASASLGSVPVSLTGGPAVTLGVLSSYLVGDAFPFTGDNLGQFGDWDSASWI